MYESVFAFVHVYLNVRERVCIRACVSKCTRAARRRTGVRDEMAREGLGEPPPLLCPPHPTPSFLLARVKFTYLCSKTTQPRFGRGARGDAQSRQHCKKGCKSCTPVTDGARTTQNTPRRQPPHAQRSSRDRRTVDLLSSSRCLVSSLFFALKWPPSDTGMRGGALNLEPLGRSSPGSSCRPQLTF